MIPWSLRSADSCPRPEVQTGLHFEDATATAEQSVHSTVKTGGTVRIKKLERLMVAHCYFNGLNSNKYVRSKIKQVVVAIELTLPC